MQEVKFLPDTRKQEIVSALLSGQRKVYIDGVEVILKELKRDTQKAKEKQAETMAAEIINALDS